MVNNNYMGLVFYHSLYFSDQEAQSESHQKTHECLYGMGSTGKKKNHGNVPRQTPCWNLERIGKKMEITSRSVWNCAPFKRSILTISKMDHQLLRQKVCQRISVMKTNTGVFVVFKTRRELKCQFSENIECVCFYYWDSLTNFLT